MKKRWDELQPGEKVVQTVTIVSRIPGTNAVAVQLEGKINLQWPMGTDAVVEVLECREEVPHDKK